MTKKLGHPQGDAPPIDEELVVHRLWEGHPLAGALAQTKENT